MSLEYQEAKKNDGGDLQVARSRVLQVFEFLQAVDALRNPVQRQIAEQPWHMWLDDLPTNPTIELASLDQDKDEQGTTDSVSEDSDSEDSDSEDFVLKVGRPLLTAVPQPPAELLAWINAGWQKVEIKEVGHKAKINRQGAGPVDADLFDQSQQSDAILFADDPQRVAAFDEWQRRRNEWRDKELPARAAMRVYEILYELFTRIEREQDQAELMLGDGIVSWRLEEGGIYHPLLLRSVQLMFDSKIPEFRVVDTGKQVELYDALFQSADVDLRNIAERRREAEDDDCHPLAEHTSSFFKAFASTLSSRGEFIGRHRPQPESADPRIGRSPVLFLRSQKSGFGSALDKVIRKVREGGPVSKTLRDIVGVIPRGASDDIEQGDNSISKAKRGEDLLFGKEANPEQLRIAERLDQHGCVLVQGPPGTGKSHTIGNLIGHLLAQGKSVLVTSHTSKALRVLHGHVHDDLQPLCVSVLEGDLDSRKQLELAVAQISKRLSEDDADSLEFEAERIAKDRQRLRSELRTLEAKLLDARTSEYRDIVLAGESMAPSKAARLVFAGMGSHDWIPGPVALGASLPLTEGEIAELYATNSNINASDDAQVDQPLPESTDLLPPSEFEAAIKESQDLAEPWQPGFAKYWTTRTQSLSAIQILNSLISELAGEVQAIRDMKSWQVAALTAGRGAESQSAVWNHLVRIIEEAEEISASGELSRLTLAPEIDKQTPVREQLAVVDRICGHLSNGNSMSWFRLLIQRSWSKAIQQWQVKGRTPKTADDFAAIQSELRLQIARKDLAILWDGLMAPHGEPEAADLDDPLEKTCLQYKPLICSAKDYWQQELMPSIEKLKQLGFDWSGFLADQPPDLSQPSEVLRAVDAVELRLLPILKGTCGRLNAIMIDAKFRRLIENLQAYDRSEVRAICEAMNNRDVENYTKAHAAAEKADYRRKHAERRRELLGKLEETDASGSPIAPGWASHIRNRIAANGLDAPSGDVSRAWQWRQLSDELDSRAKVSIEDLTVEIAEKSEELKQITVQLIDRKAWAGQLRRTTTPQKQALVGWLDTIRRIGRGYGKRVAALRAEAARLMGKCQKAVPVWIVPLSRLVQTFDFSQTHFDIVIIDEASQCDVMGLLAIAIADRVVVVGDHEQVSPSAVGQKIQSADNLIRMHLQGIPNSHLYDGKMSVYDLARQSFGGTIRLLEHFRSVPDIIAFSNRLSYNDEIKPLRDATSSPLKPQVIAHRVNAEERVGKKNIKEAEAVASLLIAATEHEAYKDQEFGVISLVGEEQAIEIEKLLLKHLSPEEYRARRILCGNPAQFQGDERDVMFLSVVDVPKGNPLRIRQGDQFKQRFNVAASRAKNQMWVVHSLNYEIDLQAKDLRRLLIEHAIDPQAIARETQDATRRAESEFERRVIERLVQERYRVTPQWEVGRFRIDIVVEGSGKKLAVECDGDRYHPIEKLPEDMERQAILERLGWRFHRIRGSEYFRNPDQSMDRLLEKLKSLGMAPEAETTISNEATDMQDEAIKTEVIRRAEALRADWRSDEQSAEPISQSLF